MHCRAQQFRIWVPFAAKIIFWQDAFAMEYLSLNCCLHTLEGHLNFLHSFILILKYIFVAFKTFPCNCTKWVCFPTYAENKILKIVLNRSCTLSRKPNTLDNLIENICLPNSLRLHIFSAFFPFIVHYTIVIDWLCSHRGANTVICWTIISFS